MDKVTISIRPAMMASLAEMYKAQSGISFPAFIAMLVENAAADFRSRVLPSPSIADARVASRPPENGHWRKLSNDDRARIASARHEGTSVSSLAERFGVSQKTIRTVLEAESESDDEI